MSMGASAPWRQSCIALVTSPQEGGAGGVYRRKAQLETTVSAVRAQLQRLRDENREMELASRKHKRKGEQEAELAIGEYDKEVAERHREVAEETALLDELTEQLAVCLELISPDLATDMSETHVSQATNHAIVESE
jgi:hypothetical protein